MSRIHACFALVALAGSLFPAVGADLTPDQVKQVLSAPGHETTAALARKDLSRLDLSRQDFRRANLVGRKVCAQRREQRARERRKGKTCVDPNHGAFSRKEGVVSAVLAVGIIAWPTVAMIDRRTKR